MLNSEDNLQEYQISISPNLGQLKSLTTTTSPNEGHFMKFMGNISNIKDQLNHRIRVFLKLNEYATSISSFPSIPVFLDSTIKGGTIMKKRDSNEWNMLFKEKMKQSVLNSNENLARLEFSQVSSKKDTKTNFFNKRILPSNQTSPNMFCRTAILGSCSGICVNNEPSVDNLTKIKSRVDMIKTYQRISENELLLKSLNEIESLSIEIRDQSHTLGKILNKF